MKKKNKKKGLEKERQTQYRGLCSEGEDRAFSFCCFVFFKTKLRIEVRK